MQKSMFEIKCSDCGKTAMIPFKPTADKPAYCKTCFSKHMFKRSKVSARQTVLIQNKRGHDEEITDQEIRRLAILMCSTGRTAHTTKLFRKK